MVSKIEEMTSLLRKSLILADQAKFDRCTALALEIHEEEKKLTDHVVVCAPKEVSGEILRALVMIPGRLERVGDLLESVLNVSRIKARDGIVFSDKAYEELDKLFNGFMELMNNFKDALATRNALLLRTVTEQANGLAAMCAEFALTHEQRLVEGLCSSRGSSLFLDILYSVKNAKAHIREVSLRLLALEENPTG
jgi:phosphate:Na+ symporter